MNDKIEKRIPTPVWVVTALVATALMAITIVLAVKAAGQSGLGVQIYLTSPIGLIHIHEEPNVYSASVAIVANGTPAIIRRIEPVRDVIWYFVDVETASGWVDETRLSAEPP